MSDKYPIVLENGLFRNTTNGDIIVCPGIKNSALTSGRIIFSTADGEFVDNADLTFDGVKLSSSSLDIATTSSSSVGVLKQNNAVIMHAYKDVTADGYNFFIGGAGNFTLSPNGGASSLASVNLGIGFNSLVNLTTGYKNTAFGAPAGFHITSGYGNCLFGYAVGQALTIGANNTAMGLYALTNCISTSGNVAIGYGAGYYTIGTSNVFIGYGAGFWETGSSKLFIDNSQHANEADARIKSLIYGVFASEVVDKDLIFNSQVGVNITPTAWFTLRAGSTVAETAPLKFTSGDLNTTAEVGAIEFLTDDLYITITTGAARKGIVLNNGAALEIGCVPYVTTNGRLTTEGGLVYENSIFSAPIIKPDAYQSVDGSAGVSGSFTSVDGKTITVKDGLITSIV